MMALAALGDREAEAALSAMIVEPDVELRIRFVPELIRLRRAQARDYAALLERGLRDRSPKVREAVLRVAMEDRREIFFPSVVPLLVDRTESIRFTASAYVRLVASQDVSRVAPVLDLVRDARRSPAARVSAIRSLRYTHDLLPVAEALVACLDDPRKMMREASGEALAFFKSRARLLPDLEVRLAPGRPEDLRLSALWAIAQMDLPQALRILDPFIAHVDPRFQRAAVAGLGRIGGPDLRNRLRFLWDERRTEARAGFSGPLDL